MVKRNKLAPGIAGTLGLVLILLVLIAALLPKLSNLQPVRKKILAAVSKEFHGRITSQQTELSLLSGPQIIIRQGEVELPGKSALRFQVLAIHIDILPLFTGRVHPYEIELQEPNLTLPIPPPPAIRQQPGHAFSLAALKRKVATLLPQLAKRTPDLHVVVKNGALTLVAQDRPLFRFHDLSADIDFLPKRLQVAVSCTSNVCQQLTFQTRLQPDSGTGQGHLRCQGLQPQNLSAYLLPRTPVEIGHGRVNLNLTFQTNSLKTLRIAMEGSIPSLELHKHQQQLTLKAKAFAVSMALDPKQLRAAVAHLDLESPRLQSSGDLEWTWNPQNLKLQVQGKHIDVAATRHAALFLMGNHDIVQKIFEIVKGGEIPSITFSSQADSLHKLGAKQNFILKSSLVHGKIFVPKSNLDLQEVQGEATVADGILSGKNLSARIGNSMADHGILRLGLQKHRAPLYLNVMLHADLAQLPPILERLVKNQKFLSQVKLIKNVQGTAKGRLILSDNVDHILVHTEISQFNVHADYARVPYPISIQGGEFRYAPHSVTAQNLQLSAAHCSFSQLSFMIDWAKTAQLKVQFQHARLALDEFYPWLLSFKDVSRTLKDFQAMKGRVEITGLHLEGPLRHPKQWQFRGSGTFHNYSLKAAFLPDPLTLQRGAFQSATQKLTLTDARGTLLDASFNGSGSLIGHLYDLHAAQLQFAGKVGPHAMAWLDRVTYLPASLQIKPPLTVPAARFTWTKARSIKFKGAFSTRNGPRVGLDLVHTPGQLLIKDLSLQDRTSRAVLTMNLNKTAADVSFRGNLTHTTLDRLLVHNHFLDGFVQGDFRAHIPLNKPLNTDAQGTLQGAGLKYPGKTLIPFQLQRFSCKAEHHKLIVRSARLNWQGEDMDLHGHGEFSPRGLVFDMGLSTGSLDWNRIQKDLARKSSTEQHAGSSNSFWKLPVQGILRIDAKRFTYGNLTWHPCQANIYWGTRQLKVVIVKADLCNISTPGVITIKPPDQVHIDFTPTARNQSLNTALACLFNKKRLMDGRFDLHAELTAHGKPQALGESLGGNVQLVAHKGRIFRFNILAKIFTVLNFTNIFVGRLPDLTKEGLGYRSITVQGDMHQGKLILKKAVIDGDSLELVSQGNVDLIHKTLSLTVLVAPLKTVDIILNHIPLVGKIVGRIVSIPVEVTGNWNAPAVIPLSPTAVGSELLGIMKSTLGLPFKIIQPVLSK